MAQDEDYIPRGEEEFNEWQDNLMDYVAPKILPWGILALDFTDLQALQTIYVAKYAVANPGKKKLRTGQQVEEKDVATANYIAGIRQFVKQWLAFNKKVSNSDRLAMGITVRDEIRTASGTPQSVPDIFTEPKKGQRIKVTCRQQPDEEGRSRRGKPADAAKIEVAAWVGDNPPTDPNKCSIKMRSGKTSLTLTFSPEDIAKKITIWARYIGHTDQGGTWAGPEEEVVVP